MTRTAFTHGIPDRRVLLITAADAGATRLAIELAGWNVTGQADAEGAAAALRGAGADGIVVLDLAGVADAALHALVAEVAALAETAGWPLVIVTGTAQIDLVVDAAPAETVLLCEPSDADWPVMLALATYRANGARSGGVREGDGERLATLNAEIARIADVLARLAQSGGERAVDRSAAFGDAPINATMPPATMPAAASVRGAIRGRRLRARFMGDGLFADPAWDMLLDLFAATLEGMRVSVSSLCIAAAVPPTTALRWIATLAEAGLIERAPDPEDRRRAFLSLSARGSLGMRRYAAALAEAGLPFG